MITEGLAPNYYNEIYYQIESVQNFVYENDLDRWNWNKTSNSKWTLSTLPLDAPNSTINENTDLSNS